jgi:hypothetical protein
MYCLHVYAQEWREFSFGMRGQAKNVLKAAALAAPEQVRAIQCTGTVLAWGTLLLPQAVNKVLSLLCSDITVTCPLQALALMGQYIQAAVTVTTGPDTGSTVTQAALQSKALTLTTTSHVIEVRRNIANGHDEPNGNDDLFLDYLPRTCANPACSY